MTTTEIVKAIIEGDLDHDDLGLIFNAYSAKFKLIKQQKKAVLSATLRRGATVRTGRISPKKYTGLEGTVVEINGQRVDIEVTKSPSWEIKVGSIARGMPLEAIEILS